MRQPDAGIDARQHPDAGPDSRLLLARLGRMLAAGENPEACRSALSARNAWKGLDPEKMLAWARLAQAAGLPETCLEVLEHVNRSSPSCAEAWEHRISLLKLLGLEDKAAGIAAEAREFLGEKSGPAPADSGAIGRQELEEEEMAAVVRPFESKNRTFAAHARFLALFSGREECFARQWVDRGEVSQGYVPVRRAMTEEDVADHLKGSRTYGIYLLRKDATVGTAVIDMDLDARFRSGKMQSDERRRIKREAVWAISRLREIGREKGLDPLVEFSGGKGFHFWFFFDPATEARRARRALARLVAEVRGDVTAFGFEVFPKQDHLTGKGLGNLVKLPLGIHRLTGKRSRFVDCPERSLHAQLTFLDGVRPVGPDRLLKVEEDALRGKVVVHPRMQEWAGARPELAALEAKCPPVGQIIASCREGKGLSLREEKILFQVVGFLDRAKILVHELMTPDPEYNPHHVDYTLSRLRGKPLGCRRIHRLLQYDGDFCPFGGDVEYAHPLLHVAEWNSNDTAKAEKVENLGAALDNLKLAVSQVQRFLR